MLFTECMCRYEGREAVISSILNKRYKIDIDGCYWNWINEFFEDDTPIIKYGLGTKVNKQYKLENGSHAISDDNGVYTNQGIQITHGAYILSNGDVMVVTEEGKLESILAK